jgi:hypothetical protein
LAAAECLAAVVERAAAVRAEVELQEPVRVYGTRAPAEAGAPMVAAQAAVRRVVEVRFLR